ncbi:alkaline phosphatase family protein [Deinococcus sp. KSM4-11]|uniref:alkaline phosphatase family protein n=1 Tax=Deinococcus sp. KSM4-11 TaxID=2568654 RepID=UPI00197ABEAE|nr:alkaline phosphatase family protein [Deinococcus sp. KSM4-11]
MKTIPLSAGVLLASLALGSCSMTHTTTPAAITPHRTIIFVWDGMRPDAISQADTPNLYAMQQAGVNFKDNHSTYPTFTMMNAASLATGSFPGTTGFYGNTLWAPGATGADSGGKAVSFQQPAFTEDYAILQDLDTFYSGQLMQVDTLFKVAQAKGLKTAAVGKSGPAFLQDYKRGGVVLDERHAYPASLATGLQAAGLPLPKLTPIAYPDGSVTLSATNGDPTAGKAKLTLTDKVTSDPTTATTELNADANTYLMSAYLNYILPTVKPDLSLVWLRSPDSTEHAYGVGTAPFRDALHTQDALLGQLRAKLTALGELDSTNIIVVSDHGHSNVAGDATLFPLRAITAGATGAVDPSGYAVSGDVRTADLMTRAGFTAFDGNGCINDPVMSGLKADGTPVYTPKVDADGSICGAAGTAYVTPSYKVPATLTPGSFVIAANGGSDYLYQPEHDAAQVARAVKFLQSRQEYGAIFVDDRYQIPGTLPMSKVHLENASGRNPDIVVSFNFNAAATVQGFPGTEYESAGNNRGMHGSFSPIDVHNTLLASGPNFRTGFANTAPSGNVDVAPTVAAIFGVSLPKADGRVLFEALRGNDALTVPVTAQTVTPASAATGLIVARPTDPDGKDIDASQTSYSFDLKVKTVTQAGKSYTYLDRAAPVRK